MSDILTAAIVDPEVLTRQARDAGLILQRTNPLNAEAPMSALNGAEVCLEIRATPGHTPESISVEIYEHRDDPVPYRVG
jgi:glyoxylase-like metal-dependent hydrolase (beta-lactamase superfamily II)